MKLVNAALVVYDRQRVTERLIFEVLESCVPLGIQGPASRDSGVYGSIQGKAATTNGDGVASRCDGAYIDTSSALCGAFTAALLAAGLILDMN